MIRRVALSVVSWDLLKLAQPESMPIMAKEVVQYCYITFASLVMNHTSGIAFIMGGIFTPVAILKMLELIAIDIPGIQRFKLNYETRNRLRFLFVPFISHLGY